jgi:GGDEF domain-containing protein
MSIDPLEPRSMALACALASLFLAVVMATIRNPWVKTRGAKWFALAGLATSLSFLLVTLPAGEYGAILTELRAANTVLIFGLLVSGICSFLGRPPPWVMLALSLLVMLLVARLYPESRDDVAPRVLTFSLLVVGWSLSGVWLLLRHRVRGLPALGPSVTCLGLILLAMFASLRAIWLFSHGTVSGALAFHAPVNVWLLFAGFGALLMVLTGLTMMLNGRMVLEVRRWTSHDALTGAFNRRGFNEEWPQWQRKHGPGHVVLLDLDRNDRKPPEEAALLAFFQGLEALLPDASLLGRQGGGSFLVAVAQTHSAEQVDDWCKQVAKDTAQRMALLMGGRGIGVNLSIGTAAVHNTLADAARRANMDMTGAHVHGARSSHAAGLGA